jgi:hypothetical protein
LHKINKNCIIYFMKLPEQHEELADSVELKPASDIEAVQAETFDTQAQLPRANTQFADALRDIAGDELKDTGRLPSRKLSPAEARQLNVSAKNELGEVFNPLCQHAAALVVPEVVQGDANKLLQRIVRLPVHRLPYGNEAILRQTSVKGGPRYRWSTFLVAENLKSALAEAATDDEAVDPVAWQRYEQYMASLQPHEREAIELAQWERAHSSGGNIGWQQLDDFILVSNPYLNGLEMGDVVMPIGEYGEEFARNLALGVVALQALMHLHLDVKAADASKAHKEVLRRYTVRGAKQEPEPSWSSTLDTMHEGVLSNANALTLLTSEKVEGYDDPYKLIEDIVAEGLVEDLARRMAAGIVGPAALKGSYLQGALLGEGPVLSESFKYWLRVTLQESRKDYDYMEVSHTDQYNNALYKRASFLTNKLCPASGGGIRMQAEALLKMVSFVRDIATKQGIK